jgi:sugar phosphate permease
MPFKTAQPEDKERGVLPNRPDLKKRWAIILPAVFVTYSLAYVDRANYGFGAAAGMAETLHITSSQSALLGSLFFLGYFLFQIPGAAFASRRSARLLIGLSLATWGILASLTGFIRVFWLLALDRLLLGAAESFIMPGMLILLTKWFTRAERSRANTVLILGNPVTVLWMSAVTGYIIRSFGWQKTFIIEGIPSVLWALVWYSFIRDRPDQADWLGAESCADLNRAIAAEQSAIPRMAGFSTALADRNVLLMCAQYFLWCIGVYGFVLWLPVMIRSGSSTGIGVTGLLSAVPYVFAVLLMLLVSHMSDRSVQRARFVWPFLIIAGLAFLGSYFTSGISFWIAYGFLIVAGAAMYAPYGPFFAIIPETVPNNVAAKVIALVNSIGALGSFVGSWLVGYLQGATGNSRAGYLLMGISLLLSGALWALMRSGSDTVWGEDQDRPGMNALPVEQLR